MKPLETYMWRYVQGARCIDRIDHFITRIAKSKGMSLDEVKNLAYRIAEKLLCTDRGIECSVNAYMERIDGKFISDFNRHDEILRGRNVTAFMRQHEQNELEKISRLLEKSVIECKQEQRQYVLLVVDRGFWQFSKKKMYESKRFRLEEKHMIESKRLIKKIKEALKNEASKNNG